jgi:predicted ATPase
VRSDLPSGTVTFLFTDVEGSTRLLHALGAEAYAEALAEHRRVIREACASEGGVEVDTQGDAFFFAFPTAPGALAAASAFTEALASGPIQVRVGLHTGTSLLTEEGYVGDDVHVAARVASSGHGGQVLVSSSTAQLVETELTDLGEHRLKDIAESVAIYQLGEASFPPLKTISNTNLPRPASSFVGREAELREVLSRIEAGARLVTLTGPGGTGKTRLALEAALTLVPEYKAGVFWVGLASLRDPALVSETVAQALGAKDSLAAHIGERELLLLLDNLEQVIETAPELGSLLAACPNLSLLCTSRELLRVSGEVEYAVPPLAEPEAVELFCARSQLPPSEEIVELCMRLDALPLAIELAAARCKALSPAQILERLSGRLDLLKAGRDADPRQQTLRATIEWSYDLLTPEEQELFARLSVFAGGCTLEAAEEVCDADLDTLQSLTGKSLLQRRAGAAGPRLWMFETIREYAGAQLELPDQVDDIARRHFDYCLELSRPLPRMFEEGAADVTLFERLDDERDNLRAAFAWALRTEADLALDLAGLLGWYWHRRGSYAEGREKLAVALGAATEAAPRVRARARWMAGLLASMQGDLDVARDDLRQALALYRQLGDESGQGYVLNSLALVALWRGDQPEATRLLEEALEAVEGTTAPATLEWVLLRGLAMAASAGGDRVRAVEFGRTLVSKVRGKEPNFFAQSLNLLGGWLEAIDETAEARVCFQESIEISRTHGLARTLPYALASLGHLLLDSDIALAVDRYRESLRLMHEMGDTRGVATCLQGLAATRLARGETYAASQLLAAASRIRRDVGATLDARGQAEVDAMTARLEAALEDEAFRAVWADDTVLPLDQAVELALSLSADG